MKDASTSGSDAKKMDKEKAEVKLHFKRVIHEGRECSRAGHPNARQCKARGTHVVCCRRAETALQLREKKNKLGQKSECRHDKAGEGRVFCPEPRPRPPRHAGVDGEVRRMKSDQVCGTERRNFGQRKEGEGTQMTNSRSLIQLNLEWPTACLRAATRAANLR